MLAMSHNGTDSRVYRLFEEVRGPLFGVVGPLPPTPMEKRPTRTGHRLVAGKAAGSDGSNPGPNMAERAASQAGAMASATSGGVTGRRVEGLLCMSWQGPHRVRVPSLCEIF